MSVIDRGISRIRMKSNMLISLILMIALATSMIAVSLSLYQESDDSPESPAPAGISYTTHAPIMIFGIPPFNFSAANGVVSGNGSVSDPYIIEGWDIAVPAGFGITIASTTDYFVIRDCYIHITSAGGNNWAIFLSNCTNGVLENNTCSYDGVGYAGFGIGLAMTSNIAVIGNNCTNLIVGIASLSSDGDALSNNNCSLNMWGISIMSSSNYTVSGNQLCNNLLFGANITYVDSTMGPASNNRIWNNTFIGNNGAGSVYSSSHIQAFDNGTDNWWNNTEGYGNYWSDWAIPNDDPPWDIVDDPYLINGSAGTYDYYPRTTPFIIPEPPVLVLVPLMLIAFMLISGKSRRKKEKED